MIPEISVAVSINNSYEWVSDMQWYKAEVCTAVCDLEIALGDVEADVLAGRSRSVIRILSNLPNHYLTRTDYQVWFGVWA